MDIHFHRSLKIAPGLRLRLSRSGFGLSSTSPFSFRPKHERSRPGAPYFERQRRANHRPLMSLMPGPVEIAPSVRRAFLRPPVTRGSRSARVTSRVQSLIHLAPASVPWNFAL
jgi:hypothetical protein